MKKTILLLLLIIPFGCTRNPFYPDNTVYSRVNKDGKEFIISYDQAMNDPNKTSLSVGLVMPDGSDFAYYRDKVDPTHKMILGQIYERFYTTHPSSSPSPTVSDGINTHVTIK